MPLIHRVWMEDDNGKSTLLGEFTEESDAWKLVYNKSISHGETLIVTHHDPIIERQNGEYLRVRNLVYVHLFGECR